MTKSLLFTIRKGGVGKTTIATNQAVLLSKIGKTLLIDLDPQGNVLNNFGFNPYKANIKCINDVVESNLKIKDAVITENRHHIPNLDILPANFTLGEYFNEDNAGEHYRQVARYLVNYIKNCKDYEYIVIDTNPAWNPLIAYLINIVSAVCVPMVPESNSSLATFDFIDEIFKTSQNKNPNLKLFIIPNRYAIRKYKGEIIQDGEYQVLDNLKAHLKKVHDKNIYLCEPIANSKQYSNAVLFDHKPIVYVEKITTYRKPKRQQKLLNEFILKNI